MEVVANQRVYYKGALYIQGDKFDVDDPKQDKVTREFLACRAIRAVDAPEDVAAAPASVVQPARPRYNRRDMTATEK